MTKVGVWEVGNTGPARLGVGRIDLEAHLEEWIEGDPSLVQLGLTVLARQLTIAAGRIDLLALDPNGQWVIIEVKSGQVDRDTVAQALDYAAALSELNEEGLRAALSSQLASRGLDLDSLLRERDALDSLQPELRRITMNVVGIGAAPRLECMTRFLRERYQFPITTVLFSVFRTSDGGQVMVREVPEDEAERAVEGRWKSSSVEEQQAIAYAAGVGDILRTLLKAATDRGLSMRTWKRSIMVAPPGDARRCLYTVWSTPQHGKLRVYVEPKAFSEFFGVPEDVVAGALGPAGYRLLDKEGAEKLARAVLLTVPEPNEESDRNEQADARPTEFPTILPETLEPS